MKPFALLRFFASLCWVFIVLVAQGNGTPTSSLSRGKRDFKDLYVRVADGIRMLRQVMKSNGVQAYIVPSEDAHQSEFVPKYLRRLEFISGFSGSNGRAFITLEKTALLTDSRYYEQAEKELGPSWEILKQEPNGIKPEDWLKKNMKPGETVGFDSNIISHDQFLDLGKALEEARIKVKGIEENLIDVIWKVNRPPQPDDEVRTHPLKYAGEPWLNKVRKIREKLARKEAKGLIITSLHHIAWLFNLRGNDVPFTPVFESYAFITANIIKLYIKPNKLTEEAKEHLRPNNCSNRAECVQITPYASFSEDILEQISKLENVLVPDKCSHALCGNIPEEKMITAQSPVLDLISIKNDNERKGMRSAHLKDVVAQVTLLAEIEKSLKHRTWKEMQVVKRLKELRNEQELYRGDSFATIAASGPNAAVVHYVPNENTERKLSNTEVLLLDTGGQYLDGTVDLTRTWHFGAPADEEKEAYTRVLMGSINLFTLVFPEGVTEKDVDILARTPLFEAGMQYFHGTGHGIGSYLNVHEYPPLIGARALNAFTLKEGMITSIEPGYYESGKFGIRLETTAEIVKIPVKAKTNTTFLGFKPVAFIPFEPKLIKFDLLNNKQVDWLNWYNKETVKILGEELRRQGKKDASSWLLRKVFALSMPKVHVFINQTGAKQNTLKKSLN